MRASSIQVLFNNEETAKRKQERYIYEILLYFIFYSVFVAITIPSTNQPTNWLIQNRIVLWNSLKTKQNKKRPKQRRTPNDSSMLCVCLLGISFQNEISISRFGQMNIFLINTFFFVLEFKSYFQLWIWMNLPSFVIINIIWKYDAHLNWYFFFRFYIRNENK